MQRKLNQIEKLNRDRDSKQQIVVLNKLRPKSTRDRDIINQIYNYNPKDRDINYSKVIPTNFKIKIVVLKLKDRDNNQIYNYKLTSSVGLDVKKMFYQITQKSSKNLSETPERVYNFLCL